MPGTEDPSSKTGGARGQGPEQQDGAAREGEERSLESHVSRRSTNTETAGHSPGTGARNKGPGVQK